MGSDLWTYREEVKSGRAGVASEVEELDLTGFSVEARDGDVGKVDQATYEDGKSFVVVDTGPPIFGKKVMVPAALVRTVDAVAQAIEVDATKDLLEGVPEVDEARLDDESYRAEVGRHFPQAG
jgi:hypothetical protein